MDPIALPLRNYAEKTRCVSRSTNCRAEGRPTRLRAPSARYLLAIVVERIVKKEDIICGFAIYSGVPEVVGRAPGVDSVPAL
jgi:hypothetical protein